MARPIEQHVRLAWRLRYGLSKQIGKQWSDAFLCQLGLCKSDEARRLLLGISEKGITEWADMPRMAVGQYNPNRHKYTKAPR
jgi:hypothetical protein